MNITGVYYFCKLWYCLYVHQQEWCQLRLIIYPIFITLPHNLRQLPFSSPPPAEYASTNDRLRRPLSSGGHVKSYDCVAPRLPNEAGMTMTTYPTTADLSANHHASGEVSVLLLQGRRHHCYRPLRQNPEIFKGSIDTSAWTEEYQTILQLLIQLQNHYLPLLRLQTKTSGVQRKIDP